MTGEQAELDQVFPVFAVRDLGEAVAFYREKLGFSLAWSWGDPPVRVGVRLGKVELQLVCDPGTGAWGPSTVYCHMSGIDAYCAACRARGVEFALELGQRPWGARDFRVVDPSGNRLGFAEVTT
jgi:catechol 2,3-dioxygenase-like lactoylglutathione lyase family enzyme